ncbi:NACHT domain-containing protein [candidate division KSB1 bacterium]|nr:SUMF1/EgtB/PvdO family nonheme iron enzyme [candidate division KSB1 bacterium]RQW05893.1 MAG: NACHT domain-containing protein [candidate division KSB1 bacterium]
MQKITSLLNDKTVLIGIAGAVAGSVATYLLVKFGGAIGKFFRLVWFGMTGRLEKKQFEEKYLNYLVQSHQFLGLIPTSKNVPVKKGYRKTNLEQVYTSLQFAGEREKEKPDDEEHAFSQSMRRGNFRKTHLKSHPEEEDLGFIIEQNNYVLFKGDPGSGKTTLLRYLAVSCARAIRASKQEGDDKRILKKRLGWAKKRFPIFVSLIGLQGRDPEKTLVEAFMLNLPPELRKICPTHYFEKRLSKGHCLVLLDAFDELGNRESRDVIAERIGGFINDYQNADNKIVVTSRIVGYEDQLADYNFATYKVQDLDAAGRSRLVKQRFEAIALTEASGETPQTQDGIMNDFRQKAESLLECLQANDHLERLTHNPLLLTLIVLIAAANIEIPSERHALYRECVEVLSDRWGRTKLARFRQKTTGRSLVSLEHKKKLLSALAFEMQTKRREIHEQSLLPRTQVESLFARILKEELKIPVRENSELSDQFHQHLASTLLDDIRDQHGILIEKGYDRHIDDALVAFSHLSFQEYLAALYIVHKNAYSTLCDNLTHPAWSEVVKLYRAIHGGDDIIKTMLHDSTEQPQGLLLAATCSAEYPDGISPNLLQKIKDSLRHSVMPDTGEINTAFIEAIAGLGGQENIDQLLSFVTLNEKAAIIVLQKIGEASVLATDKKYAAVKLLHLMETTQFSLEAKKELGRALDRLGDPRFDQPAMIYIPSGSFLYGDNKKSIRCPAFEIGTYPVTNLEYKRFVDASGHQQPEDWKDGFYPAGKGNHPVVNVTWFDAQAYCHWLSENTGSKSHYRLPTEIEWEKTARGSDGRVYPWGDKFDKTKCNNSRLFGGTSTVGLFPDDKSPYGLYDCAGNVWEWTSSSWEKQSLRTLVRRKRGLSVVRGGSWYDFDPVYFRCAYRDRYYPGYRGDYLGFRLARSAQ